MKLTNFHTHTNFSDGENTAEEMVQEAIRLGFTDYGITDHSFASCDLECGMLYTAYDSYKKEVRRLKEAYKDKIRIYCGIEQDYYSDHPAEGFDYIIGSVHYIRIKDEFVTVDFGGEKGFMVLKDAAGRYFNGDIYSLLELYFETVSHVVQKTGADIIGHFDVISKANESFPFFDPSHPRYIASWQKAVDSLIPEGKIFEINVSQVLRGTKTEPYPSNDIQNYIRSKGGRLYYTGDTHSIIRLQEFAEFLRKRC
ncbi:MAG: histidinol-phosphatase HisJ family protein [Parasporobacterium sp.]|nr:histidinol-phosphatase HisJ family protein [Parasporobacterium sp.]